MTLLPVTGVSSRENRTESWRTQTPVVDYSKCIRCMICWKFCPDDSFTIGGADEFVSPGERIGKMPVPVIDYDHCKGCGICSYECPEKCIEMLEGGKAP